MKKEVKKQKGDFVVKKIFAFLLTFTMLFSMTVIGAQASFSDTEDTKWETAVEVLNALGIVEGKEEGEYDPEGSLTRAEMATIILRAVNMQSTASAGLVFTDVAQDHWAYANIAAAYQLGIINGTSATAFAPDAPVTGEQAVKMVVSALGYTVKAEAQGGYPSGYLTVASQLSLLKGVEIGGNMTRGDMAILLYNALDTELFLPAAYGGEVFEFETDATKTLLSYYLKTEHIVDAVSATPMMKYRDLSMRPARKLAMDEVAVGERVLKVGNTDAQNLFGIRSDIYIRTEGDSDTATILAIIPRSFVEVINVKVQDIEEGQTNTAQFVYMDKNGNDKKISIAGAKFFYNGHEETVSTDFLTPSAGTVRLVVENGNCMFVIVESFTNYMVDSVNKEDKEIRLKNVSTPIIMDEIPTVFTDELNLPLIIDDVAKYDILSIAESVSGEKVRRIYRSYATVKGTVTECGEDEIRIGEAVYPVALPLTDGTIELGQSATFRLDFTGAVAAVDTQNNAGKQYGWLASAAVSKGLDGVPQIRVFTGDAKWEVFTFANYVRFNGQSVEGETLLLPGLAEGAALWTGGTAPTLYDSNGDIVPQLITFKRNDAGLISELNTALNQTDPYVAPETKYEDNRFSMDWYWNGNRYRYAGYLSEFNGTKDGNTLKETRSEDGYIENVDGVFLGNVYTDEGTKVFMIPANLADEKGYAVQTMTQFDMDTVRVTDCGSLYDINSAYYCGAMVVHNYLSGSTASTETYPANEVLNALVTKVSKTLSADGEIQYGLSLYNQNGQAFDVTFEEDFRALYRVANADINRDPHWYTVDSNDEKVARSGNVTTRPEKMYVDARDLCAGDVIKYTKDAVGKLTMASVCYRSQYPGKVEVSAYQATLKSTTPYLNYMGGSLEMNGTVEEVTKYGPMVRVTIGNENGMPTSKTALRALLSGGQFVVWDSKTNTMEKIGRNQVAQGDFIFSVWETVQQRITVIYR
ncbi:MAG: S-layer homology domain-containing protein [Ruminococcaceae bacterium]|nr:S-layer homology domain-containing protein [Oscillospiraceae bacterium]